MDELLGLLAAFREHLETQMGLFLELLPLLDQEEELMSIFDVPQFEKIVVAKDQLVKSAARVEERRLSTLRRICFLIGYDARTMPSLSEFLIAMKSYEKNVERLLSFEVHQKIVAERSDIEELAGKYLYAFRSAMPRIQRNQTVLTKLSKNFERSLNVMRSEQNGSDAYDANGRTKNLYERPEANSSVRIKV